MGFESYKPLQRFCWISVLHTSTDLVTDALLALIYEACLSLKLLKSIESVTLLDWMVDDSKLRDFDTVWGDRKTLCWDCWD